MQKQTAQIECINKVDRFNPWDRITHVGGSTDRNWKITQQQAIAFIENGEWAFWVEVPNGDSVWVVIATSPYGNKFITTQPDGDSPDKLLSLPECPL